MTATQDLTVIETRILHVDDDDDDRELLAYSLQKLDHKCHLTDAESTEELFSLLEEGKKFDIIFLDLNMPRINGIECLKKLKGNEKYNNIPVIILTVSSSPNDINAAYENGAHYFVIKPYHEINFNLTLEKIFELDWKTSLPVPAREDFVINFAFT